VTTLNAAQIAQYASQAGFSGNALITATAIALAESSGRTDVINSLGCVGLWQIYQKYHPQWSVAQLQNPATNAQAAYAISNGGRDFTPWETYTNGMYIAQLGAARLGAASVTQSQAGGSSGSQSAVPANWLTDLGNGLTGGALGAVTGTVDGLASVGSLGISGARWISDGHNWVRIVEVIAGGSAILVGLKMLADSGVPSPVVTAAHGADQARKSAEHAAGKVAEIGASAR
jgi:hypothetical protein